MDFIKSNAIVFFVGALISSNTYLCYKSCSLQKELDDTKNKLVQEEAKHKHHHLYSIKNKPTISEQEIKNFNEKDLILPKLNFKN